MILARRGPVVRDVLIVRRFESVVLKPPAIAFERLHEIRFGGVKLPNIECAASRDLLKEVTDDGLQYRLGVMGRHLTEGLDDVENATLLVDPGVPGRLVDACGEEQSFEAGVREVLGQNLGKETERLCREPEGRHQSRIPSQNAQAKTSRQAGSLMRTVTSISLPAPAPDVEGFLTHFHTSQLRPSGDELRTLYRELPKQTRDMHGRDAPGPDHPDIEAVLRERGYDERTADWFRAADGLSLICQATRTELDIESIVGCTTVLVGHTPVNGIVSKGDITGASSVWIRLRGAPDVLYPATESVLRTAFRVDSRLAEKHVQCVSKERGSDSVFEQLDLVLIRKGGPGSVLRGANRAGLVDSIGVILLLLATLGVLASWLLHFQPEVLGLDHWQPQDVAWLDGWIGRLSTSAIFGLVTSIGVLMLTIRRVLSEEDGVYLNFNWRRA